LCSPSLAAHTGPVVPGTPRRAYRTPLHRS
jgi:hypothetical protein